MDDSGTVGLIRHRQARVGCKLPGKSLLTSSRAPYNNSPRALSETSRDRVTSALDSPISPSTPLLIVSLTQGPLWPPSNTPAPPSFRPLVASCQGWQPLFGKMSEMEEREHADISHNTSPLSCCHHSHLNSTLTALNGPFMYLKGSSVNPCLEFT